MSLHVKQSGYAQIRKANTINRFVFDFVPLTSAFDLKHYYRMLLRLIVFRTINDSIISYSLSGVLFQIALFIWVIGYVC